MTKGRTVHRLKLCRTPSGHAFTCTHKALPDSSIAPFLNQKKKTKMLEIRGKKLTVVSDICVLSGVSSPIHKAPPF